MTPQTDAAALYFRKFGRISAAFDAASRYSMRERSLAALPRMASSPRFCRPISATSPRNWRRSFDCWKNLIAWRFKSDSFAASDHRRARERIPGVPGTCVDAGERPPPRRTTRLAEHSRGGDELKRRDGRLHPVATSRMFRPNLQIVRWPSGSTFEAADQGGDIFGPFTLAKTVKVSVNPKTQRPFYLVHWATCRTAPRNLPLIYMATVEDSSRGDGPRQLVTSDGKLNEKIDIPLPVRRPAQPGTEAHRFARRSPRSNCWPMSLVGLKLLTIATRASTSRFRRRSIPRSSGAVCCSGPFYSAGITRCTIGPVSRRAHRRSANRRGRCTGC